MAEHATALTPTLVIGHKNPDTDAICSAIGYADFLRKSRGARAEAAACGVMNARTAWVLEQAGVDSPKRVMDVRPTAGDICKRGVVMAEGKETFLDVYRRISEKNVRSLPVVDEDGKPLGMVSMLQLLRLVIPEHLPKDGDAVRKVHASLDSIAAALDGEVIVKGADTDTEEELILTVAGTSADAFARRTDKFDPKQTIVICGDRELVQQTAIERGCRLLLLTSGSELEDGALHAMAESRGTCIIRSPHDTGTTLQFVRCAPRVEGAVDGNFTAFSENDSIDYVRGTIEDKSETLFPVVDPDDGALVGVLSKSDLINPPLKRLVLVDHNEFSQAVDGADQAEIIEVLDHHRLSGNLVTKEPVRFINDPVGSTSTIVARSYREAGLEPEPPIATCLLAGIISDTLHLSSPTATKTDAEILTWLAEIAGVDTKKFAQEFFEVGSVLRESSPKDAIGADRKEYEESGWRVSISQIEELGLDVFEEKRAALLSELEWMVSESDLDLACLMVTDITLNNSLLLVAGPEELLDEVGYPEAFPGIFRLAGVVSRKKQLFPFLSRLLARIPSPQA